MKRSERFDGPLGVPELKTYLERGYTAASKRYLGAIWGTGEQPESALQALQNVDILAGRVDTLSDEAKGTLNAVQRHGGRVRGENLRREALLVGGGDVTAPLKELVECGLLFVVPNPGEIEIDVEPMVISGQFVYRDLAVPVSIFESNDDFEQSVASHEGCEDIKDFEAGSADLLELNLLHIAVTLQRADLRLNKNGSPNRRSLARIASGIVLPGQRHELGESFDPTRLEHIDYTLFALGLAEELGLVERTADRFTGVPTTTKLFFEMSQEQRDRKIMQSFRAVKNWSEVPPKAEDNLDSLGELDSGRDYVALRGYVVSVLKRANFSQWTSIDAVLQLCRLLDERFFAESLERAHLIEDTHYIRALVLRAMHWLGLVDIGDDTWVRFTDRGRMMLGHVVEEEPVADEPCLVVQPNMEIMVFLDAATPAALHEVYVLAERTSIADRVVNFSLSPQNVQRGFAQGRSAALVIQTLSKHSHVPIPDSIRVQLEDWERLHQRVEIRTDGFLLRHRDPEHMDMLVDELMVDRISPPAVVRLGPTSAFMSNVSDEALRKFIDRHGVYNINYLGTIPPSLTFVAPLQVALKPIETDLITLHQLPKIANDVEGPVGHRAFELDAKLIKKRWPDDPLGEVCAFLADRTDGGLPPAQHIALMSLLGAPPSVEFRSDATILVVDSDETGDIFAQMDESAELVLERLGPRAFQLHTGCLSEAQELLESLGVV